MCVGLYTEFSVRFLGEQARFRCTSRRFDYSDHVSERDVVATQRVDACCRYRQLRPLATFP